MSSPVSDQLAETICRYLEGDLAPAEVAELSRQLSSDQSVRALFVVISVHRRLAQRLLDNSDAKVDPTLEDATGAERHSSRAGWPSAARFMIGSAIAAVLAIATVVVYMNLSDSPTSPEGAGPPIATLIDATGTVLANDDVASPGSEYATGTYSLDNGAAELLLTNRVGISIVGKTSLHLDSNMSATLTEGWAAFTCPPSAKGFSVTAGRLRVVDLGTRFSLSTDGAHDKVRVLQGRVRVDVIGADGEVASSRELGAFQVAEWAGDERRMVISEIPVTEDGIPVDLVDIVAGGDGTQGRRGAAVDPISGASGLTELAAKPSRWGDSQYHPVNDLPMVDGVFVPNNTRGPNQVDSLGRAFDGFGDTGGECFDLIWSGIPPGKLLSPGALKGVDIASRGNHWLWIHPNKAVTFDLAAIERHYGAAPRRFTAKVLYLTPLENIPVEMRVDGRLTADVWVLVDGEARFARQRFDASTGAIQIDVALTEDDRMLTMAVAGGADGVACDWVVMDAPTLYLPIVSTQQNRVPHGGNGNVE